jgi:hypothetical protein
VGVIPAILSSTIALALLVGCGNSNQSAGPQPTDRQPLSDAPLNTQRSTDTPYATRMQPTMVTEGPLPLVYLNPSGANYTFTDLTTKRDLGGSYVEAGEIIRIEKRGVFAGQQPIATMPLDVDHRYGIVYQPDPTSVMRQTTFEPLPPGAERKPAQPTYAPPASAPAPPAGAPAATRP